MARFTRTFNITADPDVDDFFDLDLEADTALAIDPYAIFDATEAPWVGAHDRLLDFFAISIGLLRDAGGDKNSLFHKKAANQLMFPEPAEFCLGVSNGTPLGAGSGTGLQQNMLQGIETALGIGFDNIEHMEALALLTGGIGLDRMGDISANVLKSRFIEYTQMICRRYDVPMEKIRVRNASWTEDGRWQDRDVLLPINPFLPRRLGILLVPERFLVDIPIATSEGFWKFAEANYAEVVRTNFNFDVARRITKQDRVKLARQNPTIIEHYLRGLEDAEHPPYDVLGDPKKIVRARELRDQEAALPPLQVNPASLEDFDGFIRETIDAYRRSIEDSDAWTLLWNKATPRHEREAQTLFRHVTKHYCRAANVSMSSEPNAGRGPVDFTFARGWNARALIEMKLMNNSKFWDGILAQVPTYARAEEIKSAFFIVISYTDDEMKPDRIEKVTRAAALASEHNSIKIETVIIDARRKKSASKLKATEAERAELHRRNIDLPPAA